MHAARPARTAETDECMGLIVLIRAIPILNLLSPIAASPVRTRIWARALEAYST